jgi:lycopene beta-cyclase
MSAFKQTDNMLAESKNDILHQDSIFDIIIAGAGCAGLSLLYAIINKKELSHLRILVIDQTFEKSNDRTWCFWETTTSPFESIVCKQWDSISVHKNTFSTLLPTAPFSYKMIEGLDFYNFVMGAAKKAPQIYWQEAHITSIDTESGHAIVHWEGGSAKSLKVFSSILPIDALYAISQSKKTKPFLWQHFKGILVQFDAPVFDSHIARLMDFNVDQKDATAFMYVLPLNDRKALVEYTLFSKTILNPQEYTLEIEKYINVHYPNTSYQILHDEIGAIPMTTETFATSKHPIYVIGTIGNAVKASTGYAFQFIQEQAHQIVRELINGGSIQTEVHFTRHQFYDAVLLYILDHQLMEGSEIFKRIFEKNKASTIFKFLSNTSSIFEDIRIMRSLPTKIFLPAALKVLFRRA